jgi:hypothetical protein
MERPGWVAYDFAVLRLVPHVHLYGSANVGVILHSREREFLGALVLDDERSLKALAPDADAPLLSSYLRTLQGVAEGRPDAGPLARLPASERFHWLSAPRSDLLQCSPIHGGRTKDPIETLHELFQQYVPQSES